MTTVPVARWHPARGLVATAVLAGLVAALSLAALLMTSAGAVTAAQAPRPALPVYGYAIARVLPHDPQAFTQGLVYSEGVFYEGTGLNGRSSIRRVRPDTGEVLQRRDVAAEHFGEGIALWQGAIIQLTWQSGLAFVYDRATFRPTRTLTYRGEGWGLTHDGTQLIMSDGTSELRVLDPVTFAERRRLQVTAVGEPVDRLNELEYVKGEIFANVWQTDFVARIDPTTGRVTGWIDLRGLLTARERMATDVLNGIAYDAIGDRLFVTGKLWPKVFEIALKPTARIATPP
jgi:glutaminyl-peptide cyclotransferase